MSVSCGVEGEPGLGTSSGLLFSVLRVASSCAIGSKQSALLPDESYGSALELLWRSKTVAECSRAFSGSVTQSPMRC